MTIKYQPLVTQSLAKQIADTIYDSIVEGRLQADDQLPTEEQLAERFGVSRPTVREALKRLAAQNLVHSKRGPKGGTFVKRPDPEEARSALTTATTLLVSMGEFEFAEIAEARHELELLCCRLAVTRRSEEHLERMAEEVALQGTGISDEEFCASDVRFHRALVDASGNKLLQFNLSTVIEGLQPVSNLVVFRFRERSVIVDQHRRLLAALKAQDGATAESVLNEQMAYLREQFARAQAWRREREREKD